MLGWTPPQNKVHLHLDEEVVNHRERREKARKRFVKAVILVLKQNAMKFNLITKQPKEVNAPPFNLLPSPAVSTRGVAELGAVFSGEALMHFLHAREPNGLVPLGAR